MIDFCLLLSDLLSWCIVLTVSKMAGATQSELAKLQREKLRAMDVRDTVERLNISIELARNNISMTAAKLAIQSLDKL